MEYARKCAPKEVSLLVIRNKCDFEAARAVSRKEAQVMTAI
jgi:hypothetical protein